MNNDNECRLSARSTTLVSMKSIPNKKQKFMYGAPKKKTVHNMTSSFHFLLLNENTPLLELQLPSQRPW